MSSTPEINNAHKPKPSPFGSGINKSLLTPCRRVGLSRKRKMPYTIIKTSCDKLSSSTLSNSSVDSTPVNHERSYNHERNEGCTLIRDFKESDNICLDKSKSTLLIKKISSEDLFTSHDDLDFDIGNMVNTNKNQINDCSLNLQKKPKLESKSKEEVAKEIYVLEPLKYDDTVKTHKFESNNNLNTDCTLNNDVFKILSFDSELDEDFIVSDKNRLKWKTDSVKSKNSEEKCLSRNKSLIANDETKSILSNRDCKIVIEKLSTVKEDCLNSKNTNKINKLCKSVSISDDETSAFTSTPEQEKAEKSEIKKKIKILEYEIKKKKQKFDNLKQASIYQKKHNTEELKHLTLKWMTGCAKGLNDLLSQLQAHGSMDMMTLINNLQIPTEIATKLKLIY